MRLWSDGASRKPYICVAPEGTPSPVIAASPHSGRYYPKAFLRATGRPLEVLRRSEDFMVDVLIEQAPKTGAALLLSVFARTYVDLNRSAGELDPLLVEDAPRSAETQTRRVRHGLGVLHRLAATGEPIHDGPLRLAEAERRLAEVHLPYHARLSGLIETARARFGGAVLLDFHSMPSSESRADIVLGDRFASAASPEVTRRLEGLLRREGLSVARNDPFAGGYVTTRYGDPAHNVHAAQIEIRRNLYMNEGSLELKPLDAAALGASLLRVIDGMGDAIGDRASPLPIAAE